MLSAFERIRAAVKFGLIIKPSGNMRWIANVTVLYTFPSQYRDMNLFPIPADSEIDAARWAAEKCAVVLYKNNPNVSCVQPVEGNNLFKASIGDYHNGVTRGCSLSILIRAYEPVVRA